jgi:propanol-preferring alcohol dehydrogenase
MTSSTSIPRSARAAIVTAFDQPIVLKNDHPVTQPSELSPDECLVKLEYAGVCHSDLHVVKGEWYKKAVLPVVGGHEGVGHVVAIGAHTLNSEIKLGDRVGLRWIANPCLRYG